MSAENAEFSCRRYRFIKPQTFFMVNRSLLIKSGRKRSAVFSLKKIPIGHGDQVFVFLRQYCRSIQISEVLELYFGFSSFGALFSALLLSDSPDFVFGSYFLKSPDFTAAFLKRLLKLFIDFFVVRDPVGNEHGVTKAEKTILQSYGFFIQLKRLFSPCKRGNQHDQSAFRQMKVCYKRIN